MSWRNAAPVPALRGAGILVLSLTGFAAIAPHVPVLAQQGRRERVLPQVRPGGVAEAPAPGVPAAGDPGRLALLAPDGREIGACPLKQTRVLADVSGMMARVDVVQEFQNPSKEAVEAVYTFPLPEDAAVDDMTMTIGDRVIKGEIKRREEARRIYEAAKAAGQSAALLDQERPNIFTQAVANLTPGAKVAIKISYVHLLKYDEGEYEFSFPMVVGPRFIPPTSASLGAPGQPPVVTDAQRITPPITPQGTRAGHDLTLSVKLNAGVPIGDIKSQLHEVVVKREDEQRATVTLREGAVRPNKDFILRYDVKGAEIQTGLLAHAEGTGGGYFTLMIAPPKAPAQADIAPKEMVFVIDQTGSQGGLPIQKAKETIKFCLENLNPNDTFQVMGFNTEVYPCFDRPVPVTPENLDRARKFIEPLEGRGGTDILKSVDYALKIPIDAGRPRIICYMTDGYVGNDMQIIDWIRKNRGANRMFPFGCGNSVNRFLIDGMAREGRGVSYVVDLNTPGEKAASKFYQRVHKPLLIDPQIEWNGLPVADVLPRAIPDVFTATPIVLKGRYTRAAEGELTVRGLLRGKPWSQTVKVSFPAKRNDGAAIPTLWARERIEDLQSQDWMGAQSGNPDPKIKEAIVGTALDYRLMSQYTSFVAVEQRVVNVGGKQRTVEVPVEMPDGVSYEGIFGRGEAEAVRGRGITPLGSVALYRTATRARGGAFGGAAASTRAVTLGKQLAQQQPQGLSAATPAGPPGITPAPIASPTPAARPANGQVRRSLKESEKLSEARDSLSDRFTVLDGSAESRKKLGDMKPEERRTLFQQMKLAPDFTDLGKRVAKEGSAGTLVKPGTPEVQQGRVLIQVWVRATSKKDLDALGKLGFKSLGTLMPGKLLLGTVPLEKLDAFLELPQVKRVEMPRFK